MSSRKPHILLVNPWIHDFAAYDFWAKPYGLLSLAGILRLHGFSVSYIDCLDRFYPNAGEKDPAARGGRGPYLKERIPKPSCFSDVARNFSRYGIRPEWFRQDISDAEKPDLVLVTSLMTYWYPGVADTVREIRLFFPSVPIVLGGIYATLCPEHAGKAAGADEVITGDASGRILSIACDYTGCCREPCFDPANLDTYPYPAFDLQRRIGYVPLLTSLGCPYSCSYCASGILQPERKLRSPESVVREIKHWHGKFGVRNFAFYDDALLVNSEEHAVPLLERITGSGLNLRFHTPNAVHIREITRKTAVLMAEAGFATLRLGLETARFKNRSLDRKVREEEFVNAVSYLKEAGFASESLGAYLLIGLPGQGFEEAAEDIIMVKKAGVKPVLAYYSPIPGTEMWNQAVEASRYDLDSDPIFTNNAVLPCWDLFDWKSLSRLKQLAEQ